MSKFGGFCCLPALALGITVMLMGVADVITGIGMDWLSFFAGMYITFYTIGLCQQDSKRGF
jgi:hypothetical protein